jgi:hypothetical protein
MVKPRCHEKPLGRMSWIVPGTEGDHKVRNLSLRACFGLSDRESRSVQEVQTGPAAGRGRCIQSARSNLSITQSFEEIASGQRRALTLAMTRRRVWVRPDLVPIGNSGAAAKLTSFLPHHEPGR